jgi:hypothetical protein
MASLSQALRLGDLPPPHRTFQGHATHIIEWSMMLRLNDSWSTCIPQGIATFLHYASRRSAGYRYTTLYRLVCAFGHHSLVTVLTRCGLPLPVYFLADEKHSRCLTDKVYLPTIVRGRVIWHLGYTEEASAAALTQSYGEFRCAALQREPSSRVKGVLTDGFDSTTKSLRTLFPGARLGNCLRHALLKLPKKLAAITSPLRKVLRTQFHTLWYRARQRKGLRVFALGQRLRHFVDHVTATAGPANGERVRRWVQDKKAGWYAVPRGPADARHAYPARSGP